MDERRQRLLNLAREGREQVRADLEAARQDLAAFHAARAPVAPNGRGEMDPRTAGALRRWKR